MSKVTNAEIEQLLASWGVSQVEARDLLQSGYCPVCSEGPWSSVLNHAAKRHGILGRIVRECCGITTTAIVTSPDLHSRISAVQKMKDRDYEAISRQRKGSGNLTQAGKQALIENLLSIDPEILADSRQKAAIASKTPEAKAKRLATLMVREPWKKWTPEYVNKITQQIQSPEAKAARDATRLARLKPCGTVAAYKRGCKCEPCRDAKRRSRAPRP